MGMILERSSTAREQRARYLAEVLEGCCEEPPDLRTPSPIVGGRVAAESVWRDFPLEGYAARRNHTPEDGTVVSRLSPYLRHGVVGLREVAHWVLARRAGAEDTTKFLAELGWRQFWRLVYRSVGRGIYTNREPAKVPLGSIDALPADIEAGRTGLACMDAFVRELKTTGWLHNHARMWFASYVVHFRKIRWQAGERFFYRHLLDGDPASNALSWQWVASTFSSKPYIFNRENLERYTGGVHCRNCRAKCPFEGSYEQLNDRLFAADRP